MSGRRSTVDPAELYALTLPPYHMSIKDIAEKYHMHEVTCSKKISAFKEKMEPIFAAQRAEIEKIQQQNAVSVRQQQGQGSTEIALPPGSIRLPEENPFHALSTFVDIATPGIQGGVVIGSALGLLQEGLNRDKHAPEKRYEMWGKAGVSLFTFGLSLLDTLDKMEEKKIPPKEV